MDVITISSDSEASNSETDAGIRNSSQVSLADCLNNSCNINWYDDDDYVRPANDYIFGSSGSEVAQQLSSGLEFSSPQKSSEKTPVKDFQIKNDEVLPYQDTFKTGSLSSASDSENLNQNSNYESNKTKRRRQKLSQEEKERDKILKEQKKLEKERLREKKKIEQQKQKALKAAFLENQKNLKPEENIKFLKVHIDNDIINTSFGANTISLLQENNIQYVVKHQKKNFTVTWSKKRVQKILNSFEELTENVEMVEENILLYVLDWKMAVELIHKNELLSHVETVRSAYFDKKLILIIYGMKKYFNYKKNKLNHDIKMLVNDKKKAKSKTERIFEEVPNLTKDQFEFAITDLQLIGKYSCRVLETPEEFSSLILNFTKSLSQMDYKLERQKRQMNDFGWIASDSHQSVKVDKSGNGLLRLWQQQICQFNAVGVETAQAVVSQYKSPLALVNEYERTGSTKERELLLQDIQIRREAGILSTSRRIGPQLSKKIYKFFTSDDPDVEL